MANQETDAFVNARRRDSNRDAIAGYCGFTGFSFENARERTE
jgi:hypothetical protein